MSEGVCRVCGCTDEDCTGCVVKTGAPCSWVEPDLCSACVPVEIRRKLDELISGGDCSVAEADEAFTFFDELSDSELRGEVTAQEAIERLVEFAALQLARRAP